MAADAEKAALDEEGALRALRKIVEGVEAETGSDFFSSLVRCVSEALGVAYAFVSELDRERATFRTIAVFGHGQKLDNFEIPLAGTPCERVLGGEIAHHVDRIQQRFPADVGLVTWQVESYCGVPLVDSAGVVLGHLAIFDTRPMPDPRGIAVLRIFAARACAEMERLHIDERRRANEARFRDLYEEAPVSYITIGLDGRIQSLNERTLSIFGFTREESLGREFTQFLPPSAFERGMELFRRALGGEAIDEEEVEALRRDGSRFWIRVSARAVVAESGDVEAFRVTLVDVTARREAENALRESETRFRDFYEEAPLAYWHASSDGRIERVNRAMEEMLGVPRAEIVGRTLYDFAADTPDGKPKTATLRKQFLAGGEIRGQEIECRRADGSPLWIRVSVSGIRDETGRFAGGRVAALDVTAERLAEEALRESEVRYRDLYEQAPVAYWFVTHEGKIDRVNRAMAEMFGHPREFFIGRTLYDLYADTPRGIPAALEVRNRFLSGVGVRGVELEARRADGSPLWLRVSVSPLRDASGKIAGGRVAAVDVTAQKRAEQAERVSEYLEEEIRAVHNADEIIGQSPALMAVLDKVRLVADTDSSVLILGETGTGKELVARAVHSASRRKRRPLIKVSCAALPQSLIESELFGHEKGAYTGATERRIGRFELADGGTIFLDEIGEVPLDVQVKLLRVLQEREIERVGGNRTIAVDVRVIAATNRDLKAAVAAGKFRQDLYYRLNVFPLDVAPLRERPEDVPLLVHYFIARYAAKIGRQVSRVSPQVMSRLSAYDWPGNIRELENVIERAVILSSGPELVAIPDLAPPQANATSPVVGERMATLTPEATDTMALDDMERRHIVTVLQKSGWRIEGPNGAARLLDVNPSTLRSRIKKLGIQRSDRIAS